MAFLITYRRCYEVAKLDTRVHHPESITRANNIAGLQPTFHSQQCWQPSRHRAIAATRRFDTDSPGGVRVHTPQDGPVICLKSKTCTIQIIQISHTRRTTLLILVSMGAVYSTLMPKAELSSIMYICYPYSHLFLSQLDDSLVQMPCLLIKMPALSQRRLPSRMCSYLQAMLRTTSTSKSP